MTAECAGVHETYLTVIADYETALCLIAFPLLFHRSSAVFSGHWDCFTFTLAVSPSLVLCIVLTQSIDECWVGGRVLQREATLARKAKLPSDILWVPLGLRNRKRRVEAALVQRATLSPLLRF